VCELYPIDRLAATRGFAKGSAEAHTLRLVRSPQRQTPTSARR